MSAAGCARASARAGSPPSAFSLRQSHLPTLEKPGTRARQETSACLERIGSVAAREAQERACYAAPHGEYLKELAHLGGREQELGLGRKRGVVQRVLQVRLGEDVGDAAVDEELRLPRIPEHLEPRVACGTRQGAEIHVRGDVLLARTLERIAMRAVARMAHERAHRALGVVVLASREAVVDDENDALLEALGERAHPCLAREPDLAVIRYRHLDLSCFL